MDHPIFSHRDSQPWCQNANLSKRDYRRYAIATQTPKLFDGSLKRHEDTVFSSPSSKKYIK
jgi:hypothetical protein